MRCLPHPLPHAHARDAHTSRRNASSPANNRQCLSSHLHCAVPHEPSPARLFWRPRRTGDQAQRRASMASPSPLAQDEQQQQQQEHYESTHPHPPSLSSLLSTSPNAIAAVVTLATLSDSRPPTSFGQDHVHVMDGDGDDEDDDYDGGISLLDMQHFMEEESIVGIYTTQENEAVTAPMHAVMTQHSPFWPHLTPLPTLPDPALDLLDDASIPFHVSNIQTPLHPPFVSQPVSSDSSLEPPPLIYDFTACVVDNAAFMPITSFFHRVAPQRPTVPGLDLQDLPPSITRHNLRGDSLDCQGIDWTARNTTRSAMRAKRVEYETERLSSLDRNLRTLNPPVPNKDSFFHFRRNNLLHRPFIPHFQLRNIITSTSRNDIFYVIGKKILRADADGTCPELLTDLHKRIGSESLVTTITAQDSTLITGAFDGEYSITDLSSAYGSAPTVGRISHFNSVDKSRIVNHLHLFSSRFTTSPQAVFCSNNKRLQILDCTTNTFTHTFAFDESPNCAATSPDGRLRVIVGDFTETLITNAETGRPFEVLKSHRDAAFACAWADDGVHVATAAQDHNIVIWDARHWARPLSVQTSELSIPRSLRFSPVGSGPRVLVCAEADDYVDVFNAQTWASKQTFDFFGPIGGVSFTPDGRSLFVANTERRFGGIIELERSGWGEGKRRRRDKRARGRGMWGFRGRQRDDHDFDDDLHDDDDDDDDGGEDVVTDWIPDSQLEESQRVVEGVVGRERRGLDFEGLVV
ncbi:hypothetical protein IAQ61_004076 [Plenodomus lingam]|uniref:uncharacterized protein n=1 Tax=Leptosphaeria maculans TaxID=5022 RepID=UPI003330849B|nr:hypothetical protein IAQ61_004076 [Plenodomus lingam]